MIYLIVGHRGTGKTLWLLKIKKIEVQEKIKKHSIFLDLDTQIEQQTKKSIPNFFLNKNKIFEFRKIEQDCLNQLIKKYKHIKNNVFIAIGAGFKWDIKKIIPSYCCVIHLIRETDHRGRVFLDRPRLNKKQTPYKEYLCLYSKREKQYQQIKQESFVLPEQDFEFAEAEKLLLGIPNNKKINISKKLNTCITLNKNTLPVLKKNWKSFINKRLYWGVRFFELRDDQLNQQPLKYLLKIIPKQKQLLSIRKSFFLKQKKYCSDYVDWPIEKGAFPFDFIPYVVSLHKRTTQTFNTLCNSIIKYKAHYFKLAVPVKNIKELMQGHLWFLEDYKRRCFLPISVQTDKKNNSWRWYRQIFGPFMKLHFIKESKAGVIDQPFLYEHLIVNSLKKDKLPLWGAVLGNPVDHSASPAFYKKYFLKQNKIFTKINMDESEFTKQNLKYLQKMGLIFAAVTSPLKKKAFQICDKPDATALEAQSVNTLVFKNKKWYGSSTDLYGLKALLKINGIHSKKQKNQYICIWGGGGVKSILEKQLPHAYFYSARTQKLINKKILKKPNTQNTSHLIVIWAVGRDRMSACRFPPSEWKPKKIIDLNYTQDSPGLEYALNTGAKYISGRSMFKYQAKKQLEFLLT